MTVGRPADTVEEAGASTETGLASALSTTALPIGLTAAADDAAGAAEDDEAADSDPPSNLEPLLATKLFKRSFTVDTWTYFAVSSDPQTLILDDVRPGVGTISWKVSGR